jgi:hypothetical protein
MVRVVVNQIKFVFWVVAVKPMNQNYVLPTGVALLILCVIRLDAALDHRLYFALQMAAVMLERYVRAMKNVVLKPLHSSVANIAVFKDLIVVAV